jgi:DNA segregation ATPase FtsK/SpoIIIE-like protein
MLQRRCRKSGTKPGGGLLARHSLAVAGATVAAGILSACSTASLPTLPKLELPVSAYKEEPSEIYSRIARGAMACWFAPSGPLKQTHVFHADVAPPSENAGAEIVIHERDRAAPSPLSLRAYKISISRAPEGSTVAGQNLKLPEPLATTMAQDIQRWAGGKLDCNANTPAALPVSDAQTADTPVGAIPASAAKTKAR